MKEGWERKGRGEIGGRGETGRGEGGGGREWEGGGGGGTERGRTEGGEGKSTLLLYNKEKRYISAPSKTETEFVPLI